MDPIAWDIRYGLPNQKYIEYVYHYLLASNGAPIDPFALYVSDKVNEIYVSRSIIESEIVQPGNRIILGNEGGGGTTLARWLTGKVPSKTLAVNLSLPEAKVQFSESDGREDSTYPRALSRLIALVFGAYWNQIIAALSKRGVYLPFLRTDRAWMSKLRWFYRHYPPINYLVNDDFELLTWLSSDSSHDPFGPQVAPQDILRELINFITIPFDLSRLFSGTEFSWPYTKVQLIIDHTEKVINRSGDLLAHSIQALHGLYLPRFEFSVFSSSQWEKQVLALPCVKSGYVAIYELLRWNAEQLQSILDNRVMVLQREELMDYEGYITNLGVNRSGISSGLFSQLSDVLTGCDPFASDHNLRAVFIDKHLSQWRDDLPEARSIRERVEGTIAFLHDKFTDDRKNALVLLLQVLGTSINSGDSRHQVLINLSCKLENLKLQSSLKGIVEGVEQVGDWVKLLPGLQPAVRYHFRDIIVNGALRAYTQPTKFDAPIHALKLARGLIAACAGCWKERFSLPLNAHQLQEIINLYWEEEICDG